MIYMLYNCAHGRRHLEYLIKNDIFNPQIKKRNKTTINRNMLLMRDS